MKIKKIIVTAYRTIFELGPSEEEKREWTQQREASRQEREQEEREKAFMEAFGFNPELLHERRYKKEVLMKLSFLAIIIKDRAESLAFAKSDYRKREYDEAYADYRQAFESIKPFDPVFQAKIPHWTELIKFAQEWSAGRNFDDSGPTIVVETRRIR